MAQHPNITVKPKLSTIVWVVLAFNIAILVMTALSGPDSLAYENGLLETTQIALCTAAGALFAFSISISSGALQKSSVGLASVCAVALFREIDFRKMPGPNWLANLTASWIRDTVVITSVVLLLIYVLANRRYFSEWFSMLFNRTAIPLWIGGTLLLASTLIDHNIHFPGVVFVEELAELNGFLFVVIAAARHAHICVDDRQTDRANN